jgi:beta-fructofuranosidase
MSDELQSLVDTAEESILEASEVADLDPSRPQFHFRAPAQWMDDPNGIIYHNGMYHMMYSLNPHSSKHRAGMVYKTAERVWDPESDDWTGGITVWGHARSADLVHWEHLPVAIYPAIERGEHFIWFGCTVINDEGVPMAIYTAIGPNMRPEDTAQQWAAIGDTDLIKWQALPSNPVLVGAIHHKEVIQEWRDPFVFKDQGRTFMVLGGRTENASGGESVVTLYEATNPTYTNWVYRGIIFRHPRKDVPSAECPNLVKIDNKWILLVSPHGQVECYVGQLDLDDYTFRFESSGIVDHSENFYATNILFDGQGRALIWGAVEGFVGTSGWNGCVSLPRQLNVTPEGVLLQRPAKELEALRGKKSSVAKALVGGQEAVIIGVEHGEAIELKAEIEHERDAIFGIELRYARGACDVRLDSRTVKVGDISFPAPDRGGLTSVRLFVDRTVIELFINETICVTRVVPLISGPLEVDLYCKGGSIGRAEVTLWELEARDLFTSYREALGSQPGYISND